MPKITSPHSFYTLFKQIIEECVVMNKKLSHALAIFVK